MFPTVLGIGPAKSGSTGTAALLEQISRVIVSDRTLVTGEPVQHAYEIDWFHHGLELMDGLQTYAKYFRPSKNDTKVVFEKTPTYSADTMVPYRVAAFLRHDLKLILTTRDFRDLDGSLYLWRRAPEANITYYDWLKTRALAYERWEMCRQREFRRMIVPPTDDTPEPDLDDIHDSAFFSFEEASRVESALHHFCGEGAHDLEDPYFHDALKEVFVVSSLPRWLHGFDKSNLFCIDSDKALVDEASYANIERRLFDFLGLNKEPLRPAVYFSAGEPVMKRLVRSHRAMRPKDKHVVTKIRNLRSSLTDLAMRHTKCKLVHLFNDTCGYFPAGYSFCESEQAWSAAYTHTNIHLETSSIVLTGMHKTLEFDVDHPRKPKPKDRFHQLWRQVHAPWASN